MRSDREQAWRRLEGKVAPEVLCAPRTNWDEVHERIVAYLATNVAGQPWENHLALGAAVLVARRNDVRTVEAVLSVLHSRLRNLFPALSLVGMDQWRSEQHIPAYLKGQALSDHSQSQRAEFWTRYQSASKQVRWWLETLPPQERATYAAWALPVVHPSQVWGLTRGHEVRQAQRAARKADTDALVPKFGAIRTEAHLRHNRLARLRQAYQAALAQIEAGAVTLPFAFSYEEGADRERKLPPQERLHFRVWDRRSFVLAHTDRYHLQTVNSVHKQQGTFTNEHNRWFLEFVRAERLADHGPPEGLWFAPLLEQGVLGGAACYGTRLAEKQAWLRAWGYGEDETTRAVRPFDSRMAGLLSWIKADSHFMFEAQERADGVLIPVEPLYAAATLGLLALDNFTTTGMRMNEAMRIRLTNDCFVRLVFPAPPEAKD